MSFSFAFPDKTGWVTYASIVKAPLIFKVSAALHKVFPLSTMSSIIIHFLWKQQNRLKHDTTSWAYTWHNAHGTTDMVAKVSKISLLLVLYCSHKKNPFRCMSYWEEYVLSTFVIGIVWSVLQQTYLVLHHSGSNTNTNVHNQKKC